MPPYLIFCCHKPISILYFQVEAKKERRRGFWFQKSLPVEDERARQNLRKLKLYQFLERVTPIRDTFVQCLGETDSNAKYQSSARFRYSTHYHPCACTFVCMCVCVCAGVYVAKLCNYEGGLFVGFDFHSNYS